MKNPRLFGAAILAALAFTSFGCSSLPKDLEDHRKTADQDEKQSTLCLGVVVEKVSIDYSIGIEVTRVLKESPAAEAGILPGDEIRSVNHEPVRSGEDLERVLRAVRTAGRVEVVVAQRGAERTMSVGLRTWGDQERVARGALSLDLLNNKKSFTFPLVFTYEQQWISPDRYCAYHGLKPAGNVVAYSDTEIFPVISHFLSIFEFERCPERGAWRLFMIFWPLRFTSIDDDTKMELAPGEERFRVL